MASSFSSLITAFPTWDQLSAHLRSTEGGSLCILDYPADNLAVIRYAKGHSNMALPHVGAFRSVVWNKTTNRPVSVTAFKSEEGECFPQNTDTLADLTVEEFVDGVLIGMFFDALTGSWRIHTRSTLNGSSRYYSKRSFADLFADGVKNTFSGKSVTDLTADLDKTLCYTWILQHPENRIVCPCRVSKVVLVSIIRVADDGAIETVPFSTLVSEPLMKATPHTYLSRNGPATTGAHEIVNIAGILAMMNVGHQHQGLVMKSSTEPFRRWKMRSTTYKTVRKLRGNTARRDFLWMDHWSKGQLATYLGFFPEERTDANGLVARWKAITQETYKLYVDGFKARTLDRSQIAPKFRPFVYGLHNHYMTTLKPAHKSLDWAEAVRFMNARDTAQKIYALNWELRAASHPPSSSATSPTANTATTAPIPFEPQPTSNRNTASATEEGEVSA